jgi:hypothetical protein
VQVACRTCGALLLVKRSHAAATLHCSRACLYADPGFVQGKSDLMSQRHLTDPRLRSAHSRSRGGRRPDLGNMYFRSSWEANIARYLNWLKERGDIAEWAYEAETFWFEEIKRGVRSYTPDFRITERPGSEPYYWEVKGWHHPRGKTALARMARYYPQVRIVVIDEDAYKAIARWRALIPNWETVLT